MISELRNNFHEIIENYTIPTLSKTTVISTTAAIGLGSAIGATSIASAASAAIGPIGFILGSTLGAVVSKETKSDTKTNQEAVSLSKSDCNSNNKKTYTANKTFAPDHKKSIPEFENTNPDIYGDIFNYCSERKMDETTLYTNALVSKSTFSKIRNMKRSGYKPDKSTIIRLALVLHLTLPETQRMLEKLGYVLSDSLVIDKVVAWCIEHNCYDFEEMDDILEANDIPNTLMPSGLA